MTLSRSLSLLLLSSSIAYASSLAVYQDKTFYTTLSQSNFIGFGQGVKAKCEGTTFELFSSPTCPSGERLCRLLTGLKDTEQKVRSVQANTKVLAQLISLPQPTTYDANAWIESARSIGKEQSRLMTKEKILVEESRLQQIAFRKQAPKRQALKSTKVCAEELELSIPYGYVSFSTHYEADISNEKELTVTQYLSILNRSGIDIKADSAMFYYRRAHQYVEPVHFNPWIVSKHVPKQKKEYKRAKAKALRMDMAMMAEERVADSALMSIPVPAASYEDTREYKIENLMLPSTGVPVDMKVLTWNAVFECELRAFPYRNSKAFQVCSFQPKYQIDNNSWKIRSDNEMINENAVGEYRDDSYNIYTQIDEDINILRTPIVQKDRKTGIFGGTARKKDGFNLVITNKSDKVQTLTVTERIPTATTEEIKVKLLSITSDTKIDYTVKKEGEIEMKIYLASTESKEIKILFEISYDKDLKVNY
jgi:hypothetical protein